jgi:hypothetical protein
VRGTSTLAGDNTNKGGAIQFCSLFNASDAADVCDAIAMREESGDDSQKKLL